MAINIVADTLIIKDIIDVSFDDCVKEIEDNFKVKYLLGLADKVFYDKAQLLIEDDQLLSTPIYTGFAEYKKRIDKKNISNLKIDEIMPKEKTKPIRKTTTKSTSSKKIVDITSNDIDF